MNCHGLLSVLFTSVAVFQDSLFRLFSSFLSLPPMIRLLISFELA